MESSIGYLSVRQHREHGYFGGYLILNFHARPLEFYCTLPVKPNKAHELLYGPTLGDFVCGEQIGKSLVSKAKHKPALVLTNSPAALALENVSDYPVACLDDAGQDEATHLTIPTTMSPVRELEVMDHGFTVFEKSKLTAPTIQQQLQELSSNFELDEPFQRVTHALLEAHPVAKAA